MHPVRRVPRQPFHQVRTKRTAYKFHVFRSSAHNMPSPAKLAIILRTCVKKADGERHAASMSPCGREMLIGRQRPRERRRRLPGVGREVVRVLHGVVRHGGGRRRRQGEARCLPARRRGKCMTAFSGRVRGSPTRKKSRSRGGGSAEGHRRVSATSFSMVSSVGHSA